VSAAGAIERHVTFHVLPDKTETFEQFFQSEYRPAMAQTAGFIKAGLLKDTENPQDLTMVLRFDSLESAAAWRASKRHASLKPALKSLYEGSELKVFEVLANESLG
jgi:heme-degrading monooxygenase HmoA